MQIKQAAIDIPQTAIDISHAYQWRNVRKEFSTGLAKLNMFALRHLNTIVYTHSVEGRLPIIDTSQLV